MNTTLSGKPAVSKCATIPYKEFSRDYSEKYTNRDDIVLFNDDEGEGNIYASSEKIHEGRVS